MNCWPSRTLSELGFWDPGAFVPSGQASSFFDPTQDTPLQSPALRAQILFAGMPYCSSLVCQALLGPQHPPSPGILPPEQPSLTARLETVHSLAAQLRGQEPNLLPSLAQAMGSGAGRGLGVPIRPLQLGRTLPSQRELRKGTRGLRIPALSLLTG